MVDCKVPDGLRLSVSKDLEVLRAKVSYRMVLRVANDHAHQNQVDIDLECSRVICRVLCGWGVTGRRGCRINRCWRWVLLRRCRLT